VETRVRRFLLSRTCFRMMPLDGFANYPTIPRHDAKYGRGVSVSILSRKDSRSMRVAAVGEESQFVERHIEFGDMVLSPVLARANAH